MNIRTKLALKLIEISFHIAVKLIVSISKKTRYDAQQTKLLTLHKDSLGYAIADCLDRHQLRLVPGFASHDLKHVLLQYPMTALGEIRLQAFMIGNGNLSFPSLIILLYGVVLLPSQWQVLLHDFKKGISTQPIRDWTIDDYMNDNLSDLRNQIQTHRATEIDLLHIFTQLGASSGIFFGGLGMIYCIPYLYSSLMEDIVGSGLAFIAGAILFASGLLTLAIQSKPKERQIYISN